MTIKPPEPPHASPGESHAYERRWLAMIILLMGSFMNMIDVTIINVALPSLQADLGATESGIEWVVAGYILTFALGLLPFGRLGDIVGKRRMFLIGVGSFTLMSALCGLAPNIEILIAARVLQGATGALMTPQVLAIAQVMFPPHERAFAFSLFGLTAGLASVAGPVAGGLLIDGNFFGLAWRPIFLINIPIGIIAILAGRAIIPDFKANPALRVDWAGIVLAAAAIFCLIFPLIEGRGYGWPFWSFAMMALFVPFAVAFVLWMRYRARQNKAQLFPANLLGNGNYMFGALSSMVFFSAMPGYFLVLAIFLQSGYGLSPLSAGIATLPFPIGVFIASLITGRIGGAIPRQRILIGTALLAASAFGLRYVVDGVGDELDRTLFILPLLLGGLGTGIAISPLFQLVLASVPPQDTGSGSGALQAIQQMGGAFGVAVISQIFFATVATTLTSGGDQHAAFRAALETALIYNIACYVIVALAVLLLKTPPKQSPHHRAAPAVAE